jgi:hypothetical protein
MFPFSPFIRLYFSFILFCLILVRLIVSILFITRMDHSVPYHICDGSIKPFLRLLITDRLLSHVYVIYVILGWLETSITCLCNLSLLQWVLYKWLALTLVIMTDNACLA